MSKTKYSATLPSKLYLAEQIKQAEPICAKAQNVSMVQLMERAGHAVFEALCSFAPEAKRVLIIAGSGNNGGDAYVVGRLALLAGFEVELYAKPLNSGCEDAILAQQSFLGAGGQFHDIEDLFDVEQNESFDVVVDGLLGLGYVTPLKPLENQVLQFINQLDAIKVSIDLPSGLEADTGHVEPTAFKADLTVVLVALKIGLFTGNGPDFHGAITFCGLGISEQLQEVTDSASHLVHKYSIPKLPSRPHNTHKGSFGHVFVVGGSDGFLGAALLAGKAALRSGCGKVTLLVEKQAVGDVFSFCPELMVNFTTHNSVAQQVQERMKQASVVIVGPGLGKGKWGREALKAVLTRKNIAGSKTIFDADALNLIATGEFGLHSELLSQTQKANVAKSCESHSWIFTPHPLEAARLLGITTSEVNRDRPKCAQRIAEKFGCVVVLKGCGSIVASPSQLSLNLSGNSGMATAGMGDVLNGVIAGMCVDGIGDNFTLHQRVEFAVYLHGLAGDFTANHIEIGMIASDVIDALPHAIKDSQ